MERSELEALRARLDRVERHLRIVRWAWLLGAAAVAVLGASAGQAAPQQAATQPAVVRARAVEVVDEAGRTRIELAVRHGIGMLQVADASGHARLGMLVFPDGVALLQLQDTRGRTRLRVSVGAEGEPGLWMFDPLERHRLGLKVLAPGVPRIWLFDGTTGQVFFQAP